MAKELKITPTIRGKHMSYLLKGAGRAVRDNSLSDTDTFTYAGICARLSDNAQEQKYLRKTITGILSTATGMADFADKLKTAGIETKVKKATGQVLYRAAVLDGAWVPEDALGSEFTSEGIEYAAKPLNQKMEYFNQHSTELQAYRNAAAYLEKEGIDQSVEIDKVNVLAQEMGHRMDELMEQLRDVNLQEQKVRQEQQTLAEIQSDLVE